MELILDLGDEDDQERFDAHLAERGLSIDDVISLANGLVPR